MRHSVRSFAAFFALMVLLRAPLNAQDAAAKQPPPTVPQTQPGLSAPDSSSSGISTRDKEPDTFSKLPLPSAAQTFKFGDVDLKLLSQVNDFDKYIEERGWVYHDPATDAYLEKIGLSLVPRETPENVQWRFRVVRDLEVNAFALPNGSIYVNSGLLSRMENEAQLAGVLAHEVTHVTNRHGYLEFRSARKKMVAIDVILAAARVAPYAGVGAVVVNSMGNLLPMIMIGTIFGYSRELEHEADVYAVNALYLQGYDLRQFSRGFELLRKGPEVDLSQEPVFWASHPKLADRVKYVAAMAEKLQPNPSGLRVEERGYRSSTMNVSRHNAGLAMTLGCPRTAVAIAQRLISEEPGNAENFVMLGDAYRTLGARTPLPEDDELTNRAKDRERERMQKMTIAEYDKALMAAPRANEHWQANVTLSTEAFDKALSIDPGNRTAHRGLGFLAEREDRRTAAIEEFRKYLELAPDARDYRQIKLRLDSLEKQPPQAPAPSQSKSTP
ncbi:MAG: M48 family metalloprotease [Terriglobales bacterium]